MSDRFAHSTPNAVCPTVPSAWLEPQRHTFLHMVTQMCLSVGPTDDGTYGPRLDYCNGSPAQNWLLRNYTRLEVARNLYFSPAEYFI